MGRGPQRWDESTVERFKLEGCGRGQGANYIPWLTASDFSSDGVSRNPMGLKTRRKHELFSDGEFHLFLLLEWSPDVVDIREQEKAMAIGISHPCYPGTHVRAVTTVDFLVTHVRQGEPVLTAYEVKEQSPG